MENSTDTVSVVIGGLRKEVRQRHPTKPYEERIELPRNAPLAKLWEKINEIGYLRPLPAVIDRMGRRWEGNQKKRYFHAYHDVRVVADQNDVGANEIHINEPLASFTNQGSSLTFGLKSDRKAKDGTEFNVLDIDDVLEIKFHRTVRMPDDGKMHQLPGSLGLFPLYNVSEYANRLPDNVSQSGGIFLPMWSREALWMSFHPKKRKCALRVFVGRVNAVTGKTMEEAKVLNQSPEGVQDYLVVPGQPWLDGIHVQEGAVRQFVSMPLGSGYTTEGQKTGEENYGGLQIEIIPEYHTKLRSWLPDNLSTATMTEILDGDDSYYLPELSTPLELNLRPGEKIRSYPSIPTFSRPVEIADVIEPDETKVELRADYSGRAWSGHGGGIESRKGHRREYKGGHGTQLMGLAAGAKLTQDIYRDHNPPRTWNTAATRIINIHLFDSATCESITHIVPPPPPIGTSSYLKSTLPFFVVEEQVDNRLEGGDFDNVKSVSALDQEQGIATESTFDPNTPTRCNECKIRLCDCIVRPCNHTFCNSCIKKLERDDESTEGWQCPQCQTNVSHVAGFSAPMNLPGEEFLKVNVPVSVLKVEDGRVAFRSIQTTRI